MWCVVCVCVVCVWCVWCVWCVVCVACVWRVCGVCVACVWRVCGVCAAACPGSARGEAQQIAGRVFEWCVWFVWFVWCVVCVVCVVLCAVCVCVARFEFDGQTGRLTLSETPSEDRKESVCEKTVGRERESVICWRSC